MGGFLHHKFSTWILCTVYDTGVSCGQKEQKGTTVDNISNLIDFQGVKRNVYFQRTVPRPVTLHFSFSDYGVSEKDHTRPSRRSKWGPPPRLFGLLRNFHENWMTWLTPGGWALKNTVFYMWGEGTNLLVNDPKTMRTDVLNDWVLFLNRYSYCHQKYKV